MASPLGPIPGTSETMPDLGSAFGGPGGVQDPSSNVIGQTEAQERMQGASKILNKTAANLGEHVKGLGTLATQFPAAGKRLKTAIDHLEKAQQDLVTAMTDLVREAQQGDQPRAPAVMR